MRQKISADQRARIMRKTNGYCGYCGRELLGHKSHIDHIVPLSRGGPDEEGNMVAACARCNRWKGVWLPGEFRKEIRMQGERLVRDSAAFRLALDFGVIMVSDMVGFYYERIHNFNSINDEEE